MYAVLTRSQKVFECNDSIYGPKKDNSIISIKRFFYICMQYSTLFHSNSQNNFNYNSIYPAYNVFAAKHRQIHLQFMISDVKKMPK